MRKKAAQENAQEFNRLQTELKTAQDTPNKTKAETINNAQSKN